MEVELSRSFDRLAILHQHQQHDSRLPWSVCLLLMAVLSLLGWAAILLAISFI